jgi:hypothetical protein
MPAVSDENVVPYDYGASFEITGTPGAIRQDVINVSPDAIFVAVAIGYGFEEDPGRPLLLNVRERVGRPERALRRRRGTPPANLVLPAGSSLPTGAVFGVPALLRPAELTLGEIPAAALISGFRVNPRLASLVFTGPARDATGSETVAATDHELADEQVPVELIEEDDGRRPTLFQQMRTPAEISFLFSMVDSSTGRELQDEPTHNLASLGTSRGERPFRLLAQPITFMPRSTMRLQVIERTEGIRGTLFIVLYGYKVLEASRCPEPLARQIAVELSTRADPEGRPSDRIVPFDYVTTFALTGRPGNTVEAEATVNAEGGFVATSVGYGLLVEEQGVPLLWENAGGIADGPLVESPPPGPGQPQPIANFDIRDIGTLFRDWQDARERRRRDSTVAVPSEPPVNLNFLPLHLFPPNALAEGVRLRPEFVRVAFQNNGRLADAVPVSWLPKLFERLNQPAAVSFRYSIYDGGRGRELQNEPLHNIAGLGIATGERPFKRLARPLVFLPRSTIRVRVEERFGRGTLFIVFQGYKALATPGGAQ